MPANKSAKRRIAKLRSEFYARPWAIMPQTLGLLGQSIESGDSESVKATLRFGSDSVDPIMSVVNGIAVIPVTGVLRDSVDYMVRWGEASSYQLIERDFVKAINDTQVKGVVFYIDSPGGSAIGVKRLADKVFGSRESKPIWSYVQGTCGSAAFYLASATERIEATADAMVGSVGTIFPHMEMSGFLKEIGYGVTVITNSDSPKKGHGNSYEPLSADAKETLQSFVESYGRPFIEDVAEYRGITPDEVVAKFGQGDAFRADEAIKREMVDAIVADFGATLKSISGGESSVSADSSESTTTPVVTGLLFPKEADMKVSQKVRAQLFALDLIDSTDVSDEVCLAALKGHFRGQVPQNESDILNGLRASAESKEADDEDEDMEDEDADKDAANSASSRDTSSEAVQDAHNREQFEARMGDLEAAAETINQVAGKEVVTARMVLDACKQSRTVKAATKQWSEALEKENPSAQGSRVNYMGSGFSRYETDIVDALCARATANYDGLSDGAQALLNQPLWGVANECLKFAGQATNDYGDREMMAEAAMKLSPANERFAFHSSNERTDYIQASAGPAARPGDFPNILANLLNKFLDTVQLDDDYSYSRVSAVLPGGLRDFKPAPMVNKGIAEELDEILDSDEIQELAVNEEVLSYMFLRRFGGKWGWTPVMIANDDLAAFAESMIGFAEAWEVTQNRLVLSLFTSNPTLLDGNALFANRDDVGSAKNNNNRTAGNAPSDTEWEAMEILYSDIGGVETSRRVRGTLNTCFTPTGANLHEARRTFAPFGQLPESKVAQTTSNIGLFRGTVDIIPESELRTASTNVWYGLRNPTRLNTATVVRAYFAGYGTGGRRERWYDPATKTTWTSIEGRIGAAVKNWRYAVRNAGTGA